ncbi:MAG: HD domain-containing phosphohydrolase, partial [Anaerolineaceae bacterium]
KINLSEEELRVLRLSSLLHDIGKLGIKEEILQKSGALSEQEWAGLKTHPELGKNLIKDISYLNNVSEIIYSHHERWDGSGYPLGLSGIEIPKLARIFAIADVYDALASDKPYRPRYSPSEARQFINEQSGILFDPELVDAFNTLFYDPSIE